MKPQDFSQLVIQTSNAFRCGYEGLASELLTSVFDGLLTLGEQLPEEQLRFVQSVMPILADAQQRGDMIYFCDLLQYEILPKVTQSK